MFEQEEIRERIGLLRDQENEAEKACRDACALAYSTRDLAMGVIKAEMVRVQSGCSHESREERWSYQLGKYEQCIICEYEFMPDWMRTR